MVNDIINTYQKAVVQVTTPNSTGTGFVLKKNELIITNEHIVKGHQHVVVEGAMLAKQLASIVYLDPLYDLAFLKIASVADIPLIELSAKEREEEGDAVIAIGNPLGLENITTQGIISKIVEDEENTIRYIQHDAALNPGNSGGPLINQKGEIIGINSFQIANSDNLGFALAALPIHNSIKEFEANNTAHEESLRCHSCANIVRRSEVNNQYCPHCGTTIEFSSQTEDYEVIGVAKTIEDILTETGHNVLLSRKGQDNWEIREGSARINISYHEESGLISGDAYLCLLPQRNIADLYKYLLLQNTLLEGLNFSIKGADVILSLLIFDRYLNKETGLKLFQHLFQKADFYDDILVEEFGAKWKYKEV